MKPTLTAALAICAALGTATLTTGTASAQRWMPDGNWSQSCWNAQVSGNTLYATCKDRRGRAHETAVTLRGCDQVENDNGNLICASFDGNRGRHRGSYRDRDRLPGGDWDETCRNAYVNDGMLTAQCQTYRGRWRNSTLDLRGCDEAENDNGKLVCTD